MAEKTRTIDAIDRALLKGEQWISVRSGNGSGADPRQLTVPRLRPDLKIVPSGPLALGTPAPVVNDPGEQPGHEPGAYLDLLHAFLGKGYEFIAFDELVPGREEQVILRHDIDFDTGAALRMAEMEAMLGIRSTYFFLLGSRMYNVLHPADAANVKAIRDMGHVVSLHFDASLYIDIRAGLDHEIGIFQACFDREVKIISFHRPGQGLVEQGDLSRLGVENTYQAKYFKDIKYMSDSTGAWRYGHPCSTPEIEQCRNIQLLIHPIWWIYEGKGSVPKLDAYPSGQVLEIQREMARNCIPYREKLIGLGTS